MGSYVPKVTFQTLGFSIIAEKSDKPYANVKKQVAPKDSQEARLSVIRNGRDSVSEHYVDWTSTSFGRAVENLTGYCPCLFILNASKVLSLYLYDKAVSTVKRQSKYIQLS